MNTSPKKADRLPAILAQHECAHAVMRKLCRMQASRLSVDTVGNGLCEGTGKTIGCDAALLVTIAGIAWETGLRFTLIDWEQTRLTFGDAAEAWQLVTSAPTLRLRITAGEELAFEEPVHALNRWLARASDMLKPHSPLIRSMGNLLRKERVLAARRVAELLREVQPTGPS